MAVDEGDNHENDPFGRNFFPPVLTLAIEGLSLQAAMDSHSIANMLRSRLLSFNPSAHGIITALGFLEEALEENDEPEDYYSSRRSAARRRFEDDLELEARAEKRIINAKRFTKDVLRKSSLPALRPSRRPVEESSESVGGESEYETDGDEGEKSPVRKRSREPEHEYDEDEQEAEETGANEETKEDEPEEPRPRNKESVGSDLKRAQCHQSSQVGLSDTGEK